MAFSTFNSFHSRYVKNKLSLALPAIPELIWFKFDSSTISGSTLINAALSGSSQNGTIYSANGSIVSDSTKHVQTYDSSVYVTAVGKTANFIMNTPATLSVPTNIAGNGFTMSLWFYSDPNSATYPQIFVYGYSGSGATSTAPENNTIRLWSDQNGLILYNRFPGGLAGPLGVTPTPNAWHNFAFVCKCDGGTLSNGQPSAKSTVYYDGLPLSNFNQYTDAYPTPGFKSGVGGFNYGEARHFQDFRMYSRPLTDSNMLDLYNYYKV
jgi:hypothetical protein